jgi:tRNA(Ile)-lysidine synthase
MTDLPNNVAQLILRERLIDEGDLVVAAVSGGADSLTMLHVLNWLKEEKVIPFSLYVAHLNHGLRGEAAKEDVFFVRQEARRLGLPFFAGRVDVKTFQKRHGLSPEDAARRLRYNYLQQLSIRLGATRLAVGHNLDDQAETVLLNILRGTGPDGLAGMKFKRAMGKNGNLFLIRPLLETGRAEINDYCREKGLFPRQDQTNLERHFLRNRIRLDLIPHLEKNYNPNLRYSLYRLSKLVALDNNILEDLADERLAELTLEERPFYLRLNGKKLAEENAALQGRILRAAINSLLGMIPREIGYYHIKSILKLCRENSPHGTLSLPKKLRVFKSYDNLTLSLIKSGEESGQRKLVSFYLNVPGKGKLPLGGALVAEVVDPKTLQWPPDSKIEAYLDYDKVEKLAGGQGDCKEGGGSFSLLVRTRLQGDRFRPLGAPGGKKLGKYFIDKKIPLDRRDSTPLVIAGQTIIWVIGYQIAHQCRITERSKRVLLLKLINEERKGSG